MEKKLFAAYLSQKCLAAKITFFVSFRDTECPYRAMKENPVSMI